MTDTSTSIHVRPIALSDRAAWLPLWDAYNAFYGRTGPTALDPQVTQVTWERFFDEHEPVNAFVAEYQGQVVGVVHYVFHRSTSRLKDCYLQDLFTAEPFRGKGIGRSLIEAVYATAAQQGFGRVYWMTQASNLTGRALYDKIATNSGFIVYSKSLV